MSPDVTRVLDGISKVDAKHRRSQPISPPLYAELVRYVSTGDSAALSAGQLLRAQARPWVWAETIEAVADAGALELADKRFLEFAIATGMMHVIETWLVSQIKKEQPGATTFAKAAADLSSIGMEEIAVAQMIGEHWSIHLEENDVPTSAGRYFAELPGEMLRKVIANTKSYHLSKVCRFAAKHAPEKLLPYVKSLSTPEQAAEFGCGLWAWVLNINPDIFESEAIRAVGLLAQPYTRFNLLVALEKRDAGRFHEQTHAAARESLAGGVDENNHHCVMEWMLQKTGKGALGDLTAYMRRQNEKSDCREVWKVAMLDYAAKYLEPADQEQAYIAGIEGGAVDTRIAAIGKLAGLNNPQHLALIERTISAGLQAPDSPYENIQFIGAAAGWNLPLLQDHVWNLLNHKSKMVRDAAADVLAGLGKGAVPRASEFLKAKKKDQRLSAVRILAAIGGSDAQAALKARLTSESDDQVKDAIVKAVGASAVINPADLGAMIKRTTTKIKGLPVSWLAEEHLPRLYDTQGAAVSLEAVRFLLYRQSRVKEMAPDAEAAQLYALIDRTKSGDFALAVVNGFLASRLDAKDRWALALGGILGDSRVLRLLTKTIPEWAESSRGKMAEYAVQAVALLNSDEALLALDALAIRYRSRFKNLGKAASEAFAAAAARRGISVGELGDMVVPWLGFEPGKARVLEFGAQRIAVGIGADFKAQFTDLQKNKKIASLPSSAPDEVKKEMKELSAALKEAAKAQLLRMETQLVQQRRWPLARWRELFLTHPLVAPFAIRMVWGLYSDGRLARTFRALPDLTLTDASDEQVLLDEAATQAGISAGMVHPLELDEPQRQAWLTHLADYDVIPPFAQLERPVERAKPEQSAEKFLVNYDGVQINGMTFKGRAEKRGWVRGSVIDGGGISSYVKSFPSAGVDVFLDLDGMYVGIDMYSSITLGRLMFCRSASVQIGSYIYDEPEDGNDKRLFALGEVPPIVFSETIGDMKAIAAKKE